MSSSDDFLSRWSRRKQQVAREAASLKESGKVAKTEDAVRVPPAGDTASPAPAEEPLFDLSKLPSLDSIGPDTDVSLFMQPGVPAALSRAALRRAWSADPAIRDFIGLSEHSWDFTKPDSISGFGPLLPIDDVKKLLANIIRDDEVADKKLAAPAPQQSDVSDHDQAASSQAAELEDDSGPVETVAPEQPDSESRCTKIEVATQHEKTGREPAAPVTGRRHGGALPT